MRISIWFAGFLFLSLAACDSHDRPDVTGLGVCSFAVDIEGINDEALSGRASYEGYFFPDTSFYRVEMSPFESSTAPHIALIGRSVEPPESGVFVFNPPAGSEDDWSGVVEGSTPLLSTGGTLELLRFTQAQVEGRFEMTAESADGQTATISGRFNAGVSCPRS